MNTTTLHLTGVVSEQPAAYPLQHELRELIAENDRLIKRNEKLKRQRDAALDLVAELEAGRAQERIKPAMELAALPYGYYPPDLTVGRLRLTYVAQRLEHDGRSVYLHQRPMELLSYLMSRPGEVVPTATLARVLSFRQGAARELVRRTRGILAKIGAQDYLCSRGPGGGRWTGYWVDAP